MYAHVHVENSFDVHCIFQQIYGKPVLVLAVPVKSPDLIKVLISRVPTKLMIINEINTGKKINEQKAF